MQYRVYCCVIKPVLLFVAALLLSINTHRCRIFSEDTHTRKCKKDFATKCGYRIFSEDTHTRKCKKDFALCSFNRIFAAK